MSANAPGRPVPVVCWLFSLAVVLTIFSVAVVFPRLSPATESQYPDIVTFQQSGRHNDTHQFSTNNILARWRADKRIDTARCNTYFDFAFPFFYATALFFGTRIAANAFRNRGQDCWAARGGVVAWAQPLAGLCDGIENVFILILLDSNPVVPAQAVAMSAFATAKVLLVAVGLIYIVVNWCESLRR